MTESTQSPPPVDRSLTWWPLVGALVIAVIVAVVVFAVGAGDDKRGGSRIEDDGALACPPTSSGSSSDIARRVPAEPTGVDGVKYLVPNTTPRHLVVCRYAAPPTDAPGKAIDTPQDGRTVVTSGTRSAATQLNKTTKAAPASGRVCAQYIGPGKPSYLLGFTFDTGVVWIWVPGDHCDTATNGQFSTDDDLATATSKAFDTKRWTT